MRKLLQNFLHRSARGTQQAHNAARRAVIVVSGLPRSGTSMMMKMLEAGGVPVLTDHIREADTDNPEGYYEFERVKKLEKGDTEWVASARGKAVKIISALLGFLPDDSMYKVIFMRRDLREISKSQQKMLSNRGEAAGEGNEEEMIKLFAAHIERSMRWLKVQPNMAVLEVDYNQLLDEPQQQAERIEQFLGHSLDTERMAAIVDPQLYRNRT